MRFFLSALLSLLAVSSVSADGQGQYNNRQAQQQANIARQNTITVQGNSGILIESTSLTYNPATNVSTSSLAYDQVDITAAASTPFFGFGSGKVEIKIDNLNITQSGMGRKANLQVQEFAFAFRPYSIVQYVETAAIQNGFDVNDTLCQTYTIRPSSNNPFKFTYVGSTVALATNGTTTIQTYEGASSDGVFKLRIHATGATGTSSNTQNNHARAVWIDGRFVSPTSIKFDVIMDVNQPGFKLNTSAACNNYQIAITSWARSMQDVFARTTTSQTVNGTTVSTTKPTFLDRVQTGGNANPFGFFTWATTANVTTLNSTTTGTSNVIATTLVKVDNREDDDDLRITKQAVHSFTAIRPGLIQWDPEFGSDSTNPDSASNHAMITSMSWITVMIVAIVSFFTQQ